MSAVSENTTGYAMPPWLKKDPWTGIGKEAVWGFTPAINFLEVLPSDVYCNDDEPVILMVGASDSRHVLKTMAKARVHTGKKVKFILHESNLRTYCRHLMFLQWMLELNENDDLDEKTFQFLELFGNAKLRVETQTWLRSAAQKICKFISDGVGLLASVVDLSAMKSRERDWIEEQVQWWKSDQVNFDIDKAWDNRKRQDLADRYDSQKNMIDWDYHMMLTDLGPLIKFPEYRYFRNDAISFDKDLIDPSKDEKRASYEHVNRSLLHFDRKGKAYYAGDIKNGPFACFGVECPNKKIIIKQQDGSYRYGCGVMALHNVRSWIYEFITGRAWVWSEHVFQWDQTAAKMAVIREESARRNPMQKGSALPFTVAFCTLELETMVKRWVHRDFKVHLVYMGVMAGTYLQPWLLNRIKEKGQLVCETAKFILELNDHQRQAYLEKLDELAFAAKWEREPFYQKVLHMNQLLEEKDEDKGPGKAKRQERMRYPHCTIYVRPVAKKTEDELRFLDLQISEQKQRDEEEEEVARQVRIAKFEASEKERMARRKTEWAAEQAEASEDSQAGEPAPAPEADASATAAQDLLGTGSIANHLEEIDD
uniref:DUF4470 domain-containing protein n=1 Tax=Eutreptiella gymnastica TaxID=73025 RepID=A0A7S1HUF7_9EUGL|mmetsp:Transcript_106625/g.183847  ORF Transcript_106625/g.183847 Transcript_106625/m.183847 type:complete len:595 (+) Transcript_106625:87-1871(+)